MTQITFIQPDDTRRTVDVPDGSTVMQAALHNNIPGIDADCGGSLSCGTCAILVPLQWLERTGERAEQEQQMLAFSGRTAANARLSCQIIVSAALDGMAVSIPC